MSKARYLAWGIRCHIGGPRSIPQIAIRTTARDQPPKQGVSPRLSLGVSLNRPDLATIKLVSEHKIRVLIAEHNSLLRDGLWCLVQGQPDLEVVGATGSGEQAVELFTQHHPEVILVDLDFPDSAGITVVRRILRIDPGTCVVGLLTYEEDVARGRALRAGARSCITKDRLNQDLVALIRDCPRH